MLAFATTLQTAVHFKSKYKAIDLETCQFLTMLLTNSASNNQHT
jgi:hypothetical protein